MTNMNIFCEKRFQNGDHEILHQTYDEILCTFTDSVHIITSKFHLLKYFNEYLYIYIFIMFKTCIWEYD